VILERSLRRQDSADNLLSVVTHIVAIAASGWLLAAPSLADDQAASGIPSQPEWTGSWQPPQPNASGWDWVRLKSNEWVKGEILLMRDFELSFDSDEFGVIKLDWEDVAEILTERSYIFVLEDMKTNHAGTIALRGDRVRVRVGEGIEEFDRAKLLAITPSGEQELKLWSGHASIGMGLRSGNTDQSEYTGRATFSRESIRTRLAFDYTGAYGSQANEKNTNNHRGRTAFDYFLTRDVFLTPASFEVFSDEFQNISYRLTPAAGLGYYLVRRPKIDWQVIFLGGYQHTRVDSAASGDSKNSENGAVTFRTAIDAELNSRVDLTLNYQLQLIVPDTDQTSHHSDATFEIELTSAIDLDISFIWDRIEDPATDADGDTPDTDDFRITAGLGIEF
jgi:putative salt-induced outer membrane protein YdiY